MSYNLTIDDIDVSEYISKNGITSELRKVYDTENSFISESGLDIKKSLGYKKFYSVSLTNVPSTIKNKLKSKLSKTTLYVGVNDNVEHYMMCNFSSSVIIKNDLIDLWSVKFDLEKLEINKSQETSKNYSLRIWPLAGDEYKEYNINNSALIGSIKISQNPGSWPVSGVCSSQLTFTLSRMNTEYQDPQTNAKITINGFTTPIFYITQRNFTKSTVTFTCVDKTLFLDKTFDTSKLTTQSEKVSISEVVSIISEQCTFEDFDISEFPSSFTEIDYNDVYNKSCRDILILLTETAAGFFYCNSENILVFNPLGVKKESVYISEDERTELVEEHKKGPVDSAIMINNKDSANLQEWIFGTTLDIYSCLKVKSKYMTEEISNEIFNRVQNFRYSCFTVEKCILKNITKTINPGAYLYLTSDKTGTYYPIFNINTVLSSTGAYVTLSSDSISEQEYEFMGYITRQLNNKIEENKNYNGCSISNDGIKCEGAAGKVTLEDGSVYFYEQDKTGKYGFTTESGGLVHFDGVLSSNKETSSIEVDTENNSVTIIFKDGHVYKYSSKVTKNDNVYTIEDETEEWT